MVASIGEVDGLGDGVVGIALEGRLHLDVDLGCDIVGGDEDAADVLGYLGDVLDGAVLGDPLHQRLGIETALPGDSLEHRVDLDEDVLVQHLADVGDGEERLDPGGGAGDDGDGAGGGNGGDGGVADGRRPWRS